MKPQSPPIARLASEYLLPPLATELRAFHRVALIPEAKPTGGYQLILDPNICMLDGFGEAQGCTKMAAFSYHVQLEPVAHEGNQRSYDLISKQPLPGRFRLVVISSPQLGECPARLLTLGTNDQITQIVHLHPTERPHV